MGNLVQVVGVIVCDMALRLGTWLCGTTVCVAMVFIGGIEIEVVPSNVPVVTLRHSAQERGEKCDETFQFAARHDIPRCWGKNGYAMKKRYEGDCLIYCTARGTWADRTSILGLCKT